MGWCELASWRAGAFMTETVEKKKKKLGRKRINFNDDDIKEIERMAGLGISQAKIAEQLGVSWLTLHRNKKRSVKFDSALKRGRTNAVDAVASALFESATGQTSSNQTGTSSGSGSAAKPPNVAAQIFFLKNRDSDNWRDRLETSHDYRISLSNVLESAKKRIININPEPEAAGKLDKQRAGSLHYQKRGDQ